MIASLCRPSPVYEAASSPGVILMPHASVPTILFYNTCWVHIPTPIPRCPLPCTVTVDRALLHEADAVVFHIPTLDAPAGQEGPPADLGRPVRPDH